MNVKNQAELKKKERVKGGRHSNAGVSNFPQKMQTGEIEWRKRGKLISKQKEKNINMSQKKGRFQ